MNASKASQSPHIRKPRSDDRRLWDVFLALNGTIAVFAAHKLKMFLCWATGRVLSRRFVRR
jgi:hypothetical protein